MTKDPNGEKTYVLHLSNAYLLYNSRYISPLEGYYNENKVFFLHSISKKLKFHIFSEIALYPHFAHVCNRSLSLVVSVNKRKKVRR